MIAELRARHSGGVAQVPSVRTMRRWYQDGDGSDRRRSRWSAGRVCQLADLNGLGTVTLDRVDRFAALQIRTDPAKGWALVFAALALCGLALSLFVPRRRVWVRPVSRDGRIVIEVGALARSEDPRLEAEVAELLARLPRHPDADLPAGQGTDSNGTGAGRLAPVPVDSGRSDSGRSDSGRSDSGQSDSGQSDSGRAESSPARN